MSRTPIYLTHIRLAELWPTSRPMTHRLTLTSGLWTHESLLELPNMRLEILPTTTPKNYVLAAECREASYAEPFDSNFSNFTGAVSTLVKHFQHLRPQACKHLLQGVSNAMIYFGRQYGYVVFDQEEGVVTATHKRDD